MLTNGDAPVAQLQQNRFFADLPASTQHAIAARGTVVRRPSGRQVFLKGDPGDSVYCVLSGTLRYSAGSPSGREHYLNFLGPGKWLGDISTLDGKGRTLDCKAVSDATLLCWPRADFDLLLDAEPRFARMLLKIQGERIRDLLMWTEVLTKLGAEGRLAYRLLLFAQSHGRRIDEVIEIELDLNQEALALLIGSTRQRINQVLGVWRREGLVVHEANRLQLKDPGRLQRFVDKS